MSKYQHIFFDLDHTLWDFETNAHEALTDVFNEMDLHSTINASFDDFYEKYLFHNKTLWDRYQKGFISSDELKWKRMWRSLLDFKIGDEELSKKMSHQFLEILPTKKSVFPYTIEILQYLKEKSYTLHLITNGFENTQRSKLQHSNMDHFFTQMITSERSNSMKPEKEIFEYALSITGASLNESIMIGDNLDADIAGAINVGMDAVFVNHINATSHLTATYTITHLKELENIL